MDINHSSKCAENHRLGHLFHLKEYITTPYAGLSKYTILSELSTLPQRQSGQSTATLSRETVSTHYA